MDTETLELRNRCINVIEASPLDAEGKDLWQKNLKKAARIELEAFLDLFAHSGDTANTFLLQATEILKAKVAALKDTSQMPDLIEKEHAMLDDALSNQ